MFILICALFGLFVGSAMTVLVDRVPGAESLSSPERSLVPIGAVAEPVDLVPVIGPVRMLLGDQAGGATAWMGPDPLADEEGTTDRHPSPRVRLAIELLTSVAFGAVAWRFGWSLAVLPYLVASAALIAVSAIDLAHYRIPDLIVFPTLAICVVLIGVISTIWGAPGDALTAVVGGLAYFVFLLVAHLISPRGMGMGDVKLALLLGLVLGWISPGLVLLGLLVSCIIGSVVGFAVLAVRRKNSGFPFGPALAAGTMVAVLAHPMLLDLLG